MKSVRLNEGIRNEILNNCLRHMGFDEESRTEREKQFHADFGMKVYNALYDKNMRRRMNNMPKGAMCVRKELALNIHVDTGKPHPNNASDGDDRTIIQSQTIHVHLPEAMPVWANHAQANIPFDFKEHFDAATNESVWERYELCSWRGVYRKTRAKQNELMQFLKQFNTTKQLIEAWPEGKQFLPKSVAPVKALVIKPTKINELLGIAAA